MRGCLHCSWWGLKQTSLESRSIGCELAVANDGISAMIGSQIGFFTQLRNDQLSFVNVHCIAYIYSKTIVSLHIVL